MAASKYVHASGTLMGAVILVKFIRKTGFDGSITTF